MCGIAGIVRKGSPVQQSLLKIMARSLAHRGPDDEGLEIKTIDNRKDIYIGLIHRRLSIIDLSVAGHQPMSNEDGSIWITCNGEIYNYKELQNLLKIRKHRFKSNTDIETILHAYEEWGVECLERLRGMFAFSLLDTKKEILLLAVDRFGIKPLYYYEGENNLFLFASEIRTLLSTGLLEKKIDLLAVESFLAYGAIQAPLTIVKGIHSLLSAHYLTYDLTTQEKSILQYWSPFNRLSMQTSYNKVKVSFKIRDILEDSIQRHLVSDVPVALFLSGGIDSSTIVSLANSLRRGALRSFSVIFNESEFSEKKYSRLISDMYCKQHSEVLISQDDILRLLPGAVDAMDQPTIDGINVYVISKFVKDAGIKVVLSGQGGDEVFGGYPTFRRIPFIQKIHSFIKPFPVSLRKATGKFISSFCRGHFKGAQISQILQSDGECLSMYLMQRQIFQPSERRYLLKDYEEKKMFNGIPLQVAELLTTAIKPLDLFSQVSFLELRLYLANTLLRDGDFMSMSHGIEIRVPYLDHELVEYVFGLPQELKVNHRLPKPLLINAVKDLLPEIIYLRKKMGFTFPWNVWLKDKLRPQICETFNNFQFIKEMGLDAKRCQELLYLFLQGKSYITWPYIWAIYVLMSWVRRNILH